MKCPHVVLLLFLFMYSVHSLNILVSVPFPSRSHFLAFSTLFKSLAQKGHNLTVISYYPQKLELPNYRDVDIGNLDEIMNLQSSLIGFKKIKRNRLSTYLDVRKGAKLGHLACNMVFKSVRVQNFFQEENNFDLILLEDFFSECLWSIAQRYRSPVIRLVSHTLFPWNGKSVANPLATSYVPNIYKQQGHKISFFDRLENSVANLYLILFFKLCVVSNQKDIAKKYIEVDNHSIDKKYFNTSLVLTNTHYVFQHPRPVVPNLIEIGGIHIGEAQKLHQVSISLFSVRYFYDISNFNNAFKEVLS